MINIYKYLDDTLNQLEIPTYFLDCDSEEYRFIIFYSYDEEDIFCIDDRSEKTLIYFQIDIFDKEIDFKFINKVKETLKRSGFIEVDIGPDLYHEELELYQKPLRFLFNLDN